MPAFDEMLVLEEQARFLDLELSKAQDFIRQCSRRVLDLKYALSTIEKNIESLERSIKFMRSSEAPVVLLSEFEHLSVILSDNLILRSGKTQEIARIENQCKSMQATVPALEAQLAQVLKQLATFGRILEFRQ